MIFEQKHELGLGLTTTFSLFNLLLIEREGRKKQWKPSQVTSNRTEAHLDSAAKAQAPTRSLFEVTSSNPCTPRIHTVVPADAHGVETSIRWSVLCTKDHALVRENHPYMHGLLRDLATCHFCTLGSIFVVIVLMSCTLQHNILTGILKTTG